MVTGSPADCAEFRAHARGVPPLYAGERRGSEDDVPLTLSFHAQVPVPDEVLAASFPDVDHHWEIEHWGTKWDLSEDAAMDELTGFFGRTLRK